MHPPTPYPASARTKSRMRDTAFREITARANAVSKSEQDFVSVFKKAEEELARRPSKTPTASRRYSVASKFAGPKADNATVLPRDIAGESKSKLNKRASFASGPQPNVSSTQVSWASGKNAVAQSKTPMSKSEVPSLQATSVTYLRKRPSLVPEQATKPHKSNLDMCKRIVYGHEKAEPTPKSHTSKSRGMLLKSARYWLEQVKLAEVMDKHGVATGFFRLAVECEAEPLQLLKKELVSYIKRHSLWSNAIQQVLLCYGVTNEAQRTLYSELSDKITKSSSGCTPAKRLEGIVSNDKDPGDQVLEEFPICSGASFDDTMPKDTIEARNLEGEALHSQKMAVPDASGYIESMDADSVTREVVSYIMSSMNHADSFENLENAALTKPKDSLMHVSSNGNNKDLSALTVAQNSVLGVQESMPVLNSRDAEEAVPAGSPPSLNVWNTSSKEVVVDKLDEQEEVSITLNNEVTDSVSTEKGAGEEMCVSMELDVDDTASDNLSDSQSKSPTRQSASSKESNCHAAQTENETLGNLAKALDGNKNCLISVYKNCQGSSQNSAHKKSHKKGLETVQVCEECEGESLEDQKVQSTYPKAESQNSTELQISCVPKTQQGNRRGRSSSFDGKSQNEKGKSAPAYEKKKAETSAPKKDNGVASVFQNSRHLSTSTPKSSTSASVPNIEAGSRTRRKSRISHPAGQGIESNQMHLKSPIAALEEIVATPRQGCTAEVSLNIVGGMDGGIGDVMEATATPGSGVRRSARLIRPSGGTTTMTPTSVTSRVQRQLGTPMKAEKEG